METPVAGRVKVLPANDQIRELQTIIRDIETTPSEFVFYADRLIRLVTEEGLNQLPYESKEVITPNGALYNGVKFSKGNCGVSIGRSGEAMEKALRECCRSIRIGKVLVETETDGRAKVLYSRLWPRADIVNRRILLLYPIMSSGSTVAQALRVLEEHGVQDERVTLLTLFTTPKAAAFIAKTFPEVTVVTSEIGDTVPTHFGKKYFGTD